jgi:hypothetical protein
MITGGFFFLPPGIDTGRYDKDIYPSGQVLVTTFVAQSSNNIYGLIPS